MGTELKHIICLKITCYNNINRSTVMNTHDNKTLVKLQMCLQMFYAKTFPKMLQNIAKYFSRFSTLNAW